MKKKFYAVHTIATDEKRVFTTWDEASHHITGKNVRQKSFPNEKMARQWLGLEVSSAPRRVVAKPARKVNTAQTRVLRGTPMVIVYTDGSHIKGTPKRGAGGVVYYAGQVLEWAASSATVEAHFPSEASNPTMELYAARCVLERLYEERARILPRIKIVVKADYKGVLHYINGTWKPKTPTDTNRWFQEEAAGLVRAAEALRGEGWTVQGKYVPAHSGIPGNETADALAKSDADVDELGRLHN